MAKHKINITYDIFTVKQAFFSRIIRRCVEGTLSFEGVNTNCEINILVTNDKGIHAINLASRDIDRPTDVLSFPMFQLTAGEYPSNWEEYVDPETNLCPLGDMCISLERATAQAKEFGHSVRREVGYLTIHSMLHMLGYDHVDEAEQKAQMRAKEEAIASVLGISR